MFILTEIDGTYTIGKNTEEKCTAFINGCSTSPTYLEIPINIDNKVVTHIGSHAFYGCENIITLKISEGYTIIRSYGFCLCCNLTSVILPKSLEQLRHGAFENCYALSNITILQSSNLVYIGHYAFDQCYNLISFVISSSVKTIEFHAFTYIKTNFALFYYPLFDNFDNSMFEGTPNVIIYTPLNGANFFGNISTTHVNLQNIYIQTIIPKNNCISISKQPLIAVFIAIYK